MDLNRADLFAMHQRHLAETLYEGPEGSVLWQEGAVYSDITDGKRLCEILDTLPLQHIEVCAVKSRAAACAALPDAVCDPAGIDDIMRFTSGRDDQ